MKKSIGKLVFATGLFLGGSSAFADITNQDLGEGQSEDTGATLTISCAGSLTGLSGTASRQALSLATGNANQPGAKYSADNAFAVNASCPVSLSLACVAGFEGAESGCNMIRAVSGSPVSSPTAADKIEDLEISFVDGSTAGVAYAPLDLNDATVDRSDLALRYEATLGQAASDNKAGDYVVDVTVTIVEQ